MKKIILSICFGSVLFAKSMGLSSIPTPSQHYVDIDIGSCDKLCLLNHLAKGEYFSFVSSFDEQKITDAYLQKEYKLFSKLFFISSEDGLVRVAFVMPRKKIGRYSITATNATLSLLSASGEYFEFDTYDIDEENKQNISSAFESIESKGSDFAVALVTQEGATHIATLQSKTAVYIPSINKSDITQNSNPNLYFGGIDYEEQVQKLSNYANGKLSVFYDGSELSHTLLGLQEKSLKTDAYKAKIESSKVNFKKIIKNNARRYNNASIFLNTPIVKSSLILSQLRYYDINPYVILSTQVNYNPLILTLTQYADRKELFIANSLSELESNVEAYTLSFGSDISYDWIEYSTALGVDFFLSKKFKTPRYFDEGFRDHQILYQTKIVKPGFASFHW